MVDGNGQKEREKGEKEREKEKQVIMERSEKREKEKGGEREQSSIDMEGEEKHKQEWEEICEGYERTGIVRKAAIKKQRERGRERGTGRERDRDDQIGSRSGMCKMRKVAVDNYFPSFALATRPFCHFRHAAT